MPEKGQATKVRPERTLGELIDHRDDGRFVGRTTELNLRRAAYFPRLRAGAERVAESLAYRGSAP